MNSNVDSVPRLPVLLDGEFRQFRQLIHRESGIYLTETKQALLSGRLVRRLRDLHLTSFADYYRLVQQDGTELIRMLDAVSTNETHFFREPRQFDYLGNELCTEWRAEAAAGVRAKRVRVWSAACSTGEEPYSLAMLLHRQLATDGWAVDVQASDLSTRALERAEAGVYALDRMRGMPDTYLRSYMLRGVGPEAGKTSVAPEIRRMVTFQRINLVQARYRVTGPFDAIFCRNVLIYFDLVGRAQVLARLTECLRPGGYLFLGHAEGLSGVARGLRSVAPAVYRRQLPDGEGEAA